VARRVAAARERALGRQGCTNARLEAADIEARVAAEPAALQLLKRTSAQLGWSGRSLHRVLRVARTIADLAGSERITPAQMAEAAQLRRGLLQV
jgi:magnesium chelatase family protein